MSAVILGKTKLNFGQANKPRVAFTLTVKNVVEKLVQNTEEELEYQNLKEGRRIKFLTKKHVQNAAQKNQKMLLGLGLKKEILLSFGI